MKGAKTILLFWFESSIKRFLEEILPLDGYTVTAIHDPTEALRLIEASAGPLVVLADNLKVNPGGVEALRNLRANPTLSKRVRVIGFDIDSAEQMELDSGAIDAFVPMRDRGRMMFGAIEKFMDELAAQ